MRSHDDKPTALDQYVLYVPAPGATHQIWPGSAIVGSAPSNAKEWISTHYQGVDRNMHVDAGTELEWSIQHAASRRFTNYPTTSLRAWAPEDLIAVANIMYSPELEWWVMVEFIDSQALEAWTPGPHVINGSDDLHRRADGRRFHRMTPHERIRAMMRWNASAPNSAP